MVYAVLRQFMQSPGLAMMSLLYLVVDKAIVNAFYPWMTTIPSIATYRMISNMQAASDPARRLEATTEATGLDLQLYPLSQTEGDSRHRDGQ